MLAAAGCTPPVAFEDSGPAVFEGAIGTYLVEAFDAVPADIDLDGDADLIVNGHHVVPLQIFVNEGGIFQRVNAPGSDGSGVHDNRGVPYLFASAAEMARSFAVDAEVPPGLYVWHDDWRLGSWRLRWVPPVEGAPRSLTLRTPRRFTATEGLEPDEARTPDPAEITVELAGEPRSLALRSEAMSGELALRLEPSASIFLGPSRSPAPTQARRGTGTPAGRGELRIWKPDPHGIAWVDVEGSPHPEIYATRGGLAGFLRAPLPPKTDRYYVHRGYGADPLYTFAPEGTLEAGYRRGRGVEWVDVNGDGSLDLSISARASRNGLLIRDPVSGGLRDRAAELGLDFQAAEVASWADFDEDGWQDQFILRGAELDIARNVGGNRFEIIPGRQLGIVLPYGGFPPESKPPRSTLPRQRPY